MGIIKLDLWGKKGTWYLKFAEMHGRFDGIPPGRDNGDISFRGELHVAQKMQRFEDLYIATKQDISRAGMRRESFWRTLTQILVMTLSSW